MSLSNPTAARDTAPAAPETAANQFALLGQRRFAPFFWTLFLGAANDNLFKFAFTMLVTYQLQVAWLDPKLAGAVIGALFILPYMLFSATSGQLADKLDKALIVRFVKWMEIGIMALAAVGFWFTHVPLLLGCVFLMGLHSTLVGPVKYAYLPQHLSERELTGGNGMMEMGTFVAILLGNMTGGLLIAIPETGRVWVSVACLLVAVLGRVFAQSVSVSPAADPDLKVNWNPFTETWANLKLAQQTPAVFRSLLGISWMWFFGAVFLAQFPTFAKDVLHGDEHVASLLLVLFSVGVAIGALLCETLSHRHVEIGLVPLGAIGMSVMSMDLYFSTSVLPGAPAIAYGVNAFIHEPAHWRVMADIVILSGFVGLFSVPMYALIQLRAQPSHRARIIAANNILNAVFIVVSAALVGLLVKLQLTIAQQFLVIAALNVLVAAYIFALVPEYLLRFVFLIITRCVYRLKVHGQAHLPLDGPAIVTCNHVSFADAVFLGVGSPRPIRFVMDHRIFKTPGMSWFFKLAKAIPIAPQKEDPEMYERAFAEARRVLDEGDLVGIFPEGEITRDGKLHTYKAGIMKLLQTHRVPVVPCTLHNVWGSMFSRYRRGASEPPAPRGGLLRHVELVVEPALAPDTVTPQVLQQLAQTRLDEWSRRR